jgi:hypothetical protein
LPTTAHPNSPAAPPRPRGRSIPLTSMVALGATALAVALAGAAPASAAPAKAQWLQGTTDKGNPIKFLLRNGRTITRLDASVPAYCTWAGGGYQSGVETYQPPGAFRVGRTRSVSALQSSTFTSAQVTKNYRITLQRVRGGGITGQLHVNFSVLKPAYTSSGWMLVPAACQGDDSITVSAG